MSTINITIRAVVPLPAGAPKAAQLAMAAMAAAQQAGSMIKGAVGGTVDVSTETMDGRLGKGNGAAIAIGEPMHAPRGRRRGRRAKAAASDKEATHRPAGNADRGTAGDQPAAGSNG